MEKNVNNIIESYMNVDFYINKNKNKPMEISMILDVSDMKPGEIEIEDEIKTAYLWKKYYSHKYFK
ncbi:MAG: hypothetical protein GF353_04560 [Candidatus Lokiarchaeota archaeon]|nr:hypothetical protein [Candidatus Lokiarchaeota archaeon]